MSEDEDAVRVHKVVAFEGVEPCDRAVDGQVQIGVRAIAWGTLAVAFSALVNAHGHKIFSRKLVKDVSIRMVRA